MIAIVDYGVGNLFSLKSSFAYIGEDAFVSGVANDIASADKIILPGVGAFGDAIDKLRVSKLDKVIIDCVKMNKPVMGICLGMQLLFNKSWEYGEHEGLGLIPGNIIPIRDKVHNNIKVPHMGWNQLMFTNQNCRLFRHIKNGDHVYFVHSYYATNCDKDIVAYTDYGTRITAAVQHGNLFGCQFHPEKSGDVGLNILRAFCEIL